MADYKISQLTEATDADNDDLIEVVVNTDTTPASRKMKRSTLVDGLATEAALAEHAEATDNPHEVTKTQVGLSNVPNTDATTRSNHTGSQTASTISDFSSAVSANSDVAANTAAMHTHANPTALGNVSGVNTGDQTATTLPVTPTGNLSASNAQTALAELQSDIDTINSSLGGLTNAVVLKGTWDASAGTFPGAGAAQAGWSYIVSVAGTVGGTAFAINDRILAIADNPSTSTYAANWHKLDYTDQVLSVNSQTGAVTLTKSDVGLGNADNTSDLSKPISTATQTALDSKAASNHNHSATDINSGTLIVGRGGTGKSSLTSGRILTGNGTLGVLDTLVVDTDSTLAADSDTHIPTQKAVKAAIAAGGGGGGAGNLSDLGDVDIDTQADAQALVYESDDDKWVNRKLNRGDLSDTEFVDPDTNHYEYYDGSESRWKNRILSLANTVLGGDTLVGNTKKLRIEYESGESTEMTHQKFITSAESGDKTELAGESLKYFQGSDSATIVSATLTDDRTHTLPDKSGTIAHIDDLESTAIVVTPAGNLTSNDAQAALEELQVDIDTINSSLGGLTDVVVLKGPWDASAGTFPGSGSAQAGWSYIVSVAGTVGGVAFAINDRLLAITDNASTSTFAANWHKLDYTDQVLSVNSQTGAVSLTQDNVPDGSTYKQYSATDKSDNTANTAARHTRSHAMTSTSDHTAGNHKVFYSNGSGQVIELALGSMGQVLQSNGTSSAPTFETPAGGGSSTPQGSMAKSFIVAGEFTESLTSGGTASWNNSGGGMLRLATNTTPGGRVILSNKYSQGKPTTPASLKNPKGLVDFGISGTAGSGNLYFRFFSSNSSVSSSTAHQMGIKAIKSGGTVTYSSSTGDGTTETATTLASVTTDFGDPHAFAAVLTESTNCKFYYDGVLKNTHTTNLPGVSSGNYRAYRCMAWVDNASTSDPYVMDLGHYSLQWDLY